MSKHVDRYYWELSGDWCRLYDRLCLTGTDCMGWLADPKLAERIVRMLNTEEKVKNDLA